jgi:hypothetical protein
MEKKITIYRARKGHKTSKKTLDSFLEVLQACKGVVYPACRRFGIAPKTFYQWQKRYPDFREKSEEIRDTEVMAVAEDMLYKNISEGSERSIIFYLSTRDPRYRSRIENLNKNVNFTANPEIPLDKQIEVINSLAKLGFSVSPQLDESPPAKNEQE